MLAITLVLGLCGLGEAAPALEKRFTGPSDPARFKFYDTPSKGVICDGDTGPDGLTMWYEDLVAPTIGVFNYQTETFHEYPIPYTNGSIPNPVPGNITGVQCVVRSGKDGMVYAGSGIRNEIVQVNPRTNPPTIQIFSPPPDIAGDLQPFNDAWGGNHGVSLLWLSFWCSDKVSSCTLVKQLRTS